MKYTKHLTTTPQTEPIPGKNMVKNNAGGFGFKVNDWDRLDRFLILGSEGGTYYVSERNLTVDNATHVIDLIKKDGAKVVARTIEISDTGRAPKNDPALFVLALAIVHGDAKTRELAYAAIPKVARIGTHLFHLAEYLKDLGKGWGSGLRKAIASWYLDRDVENLALQVVKYRQRDGWSHRDLLRLAHPKAEDSDRDAVFHFAVKGEVEKGWTRKTPKLIKTFEALKNAQTKTIVKALEDNPKLPWEALPTDALTKREVWEALLPNLPLTALIRNLNKLSSVELLVPDSDAQKLVIERLTNAEAVHKARIHPLNVLFALKTYSAGQGFRGKMTWKANHKVSAALEDTFYLAFKNVEPTGRNILLGLDVSGSMSCQMMNSNVTYCEATAAIAMVFARTEKNYECMGFAHQFVDLGITHNDSLKTAISKAQKNNFGGTDCALPMIWAQKNKAQFDAFVVMTDNETWAGNIQPVQALAKYRQATGLPAKLVVVGMQATPFTIADPDDVGMMDVVGFDTSAPQVIADFIRS